MTNIVYRKVPHGKIPFQNIANQNLRDALMKLNENILMLDRNMEAICRAVNELMRRRT